MKDFLGEGDILATRNGGATTVLSGAPIVVSNHIRVAVSDIAAGATGEAYASGVVRLTAYTSDVWFDGEPLYWDSGNARLTNTASGNAAAGAAVGSKSAGVTSAKVALLSHDEYGLNPPTTTA